jgi:hypothetical protein
MEPALLCLMWLHPVNTPAPVNTAATVDRPAAVNTAANATLAPVNTPVGNTPTNTPAPINNPTTVDSPAPVDSPAVNTAPAESPTPVNTADNAANITLGSMPATNGGSVLIPTSGLNNSTNSSSKSVTGEYHEFAINPILLYHSNLV